MALNFIRNMVNEQEFGATFDSEYGERCARAVVRDICQYLEAQSNEHPDMRRAADQIRWLYLQQTPGSVRS